MHGKANAQTATRPCMCQKCKYLLQECGQCQSEDVGLLTNLALKSNVLQIWVLATVMHMP